ncbi:MAG: hypothetical protein ABRQ37_09210 [Candidatus Eremiobacterota bacterium]
MKINTNQSMTPGLQTNKNTTRKEGTLSEEIQGKDKAILDVKFGKDKDEVFLMGKHLKFIKNFDNAAGFAGMAPGAAVVAGTFLSGMGPVGKFFGAAFGGSMAMVGAAIGSDMSSNMIHNKIENASSPSEKNYYERLFSDKACTRHHGLTISAFGVMGAAGAVGIGAGLGGIVAGGIVGGVVGMIAASQHGWPE